MIKSIKEKVDIRFLQTSHIFLKVLGEKVISSQLLSGGGSTTNYKITSDKGLFLFKRHPAHRDNSPETC